MFKNRTWSVLACSKRSDSGERCGVEKAMNFFALPFALHRSPLSERLEQARSVFIEEYTVRVRGVGTSYNGL